MISLLRTRRWLGFTAVVVTAILLFGLLSLWQWQRADDKREQRIELQNALAATAQSLAEVAIVDGTIAPDDEWRHVTVSGTYVPGTEALVRKRSLDARNGFWTMTALATDDGRVVWINRGWIPTAGDALSTPDIPVPPAGQVDVTGYLRPYEEDTADPNAGLPAGQIAAVSPSALPSVDNAFPGYLQIEESVPAEDGPRALPLPTVDESRNISYAVQWLIFAAVAIGGWFFFLRREAIDDARRNDASSPEAERIEAL